MLIATQKKKKLHTLLHPTMPSSVSVITEQLPGSEVYLHLTKPKDAQKVATLTLYVTDTPSAQAPLSSLIYSVPTVSILDN